MGKSKLFQKVKDKRVIFLDLDNTLYSYESCHRHALKKAYEFYRKEVEAIPFRKFLADYARARATIHQRLRGQAASHSRLLYFQTFLESRWGRTDSYKILRLEEVYWRVFLKRMKLASWVQPFLAHCKTAGKRIVVVTDLTSAIQLRKLRRLKLDKWIHFVVTSEEAGAEKPSSEIFRLALKKASCRPRDVVIIGDRPQRDTLRHAAFVKI